MKGKNILIATLLLAAGAAVVVFCYVQPDICADGATNSLVNDCIGRLAVAVALVIVSCVLGYGGVFINRSGNYLKDFLWCVPCILVVVVNFPFSALISGAAVIERYDILWLFVLDCLLVACMEEFLFRGLLFSALAEILKGDLLITILLESAVFALCHLFNLFSGASLGYTLLQVGYTFLTGIMFTVVFIRTKNVWTSVILHAAFNVGGNIVSTLGSGAFQDTVFWILTVVFGVICAAHIVISLYKERKKLKK